MSAREDSFHGRPLAAAPGFVEFGLTSGRRLRVPFGAFGLIGGVGSRLGRLRLSGHLLFAAVFSFKLLPQLALNAGMRRHDFAIRLCQSL